MLKERIRRALSPDHWLLRLARRLRVRFGSPTLRELLRADFFGQKHLFFVQVGSNDGVAGDPLHDLIRLHPLWQGIFIEPVPYLFDRLKSNYQGRANCYFENVAVSDAPADLVFYYVSPAAKNDLGDQLPDWFDQLGSFDKSHITKHLNGVLEPYIVAQEVRCATLSSIVDKYKPSRVDLLHIDTEGFDYKVLRQFCFDRYLPAVVVFEHIHLSQEEKLGAIGLLKRRGYEIMERQNDIIGRLTWWRRLVTPPLFFTLSNLLKMVYKTARGNGMET